jgi:hypothetical protein
MTEPGGHQEDHAEHPAAEALQFLLVAAGALLVLKLAHAGAERVLAPAPDDAIAQVAAPFRRGYLLRDAHALVTSGVGFSARGALALLVSLAGAAAGAILGRAVALLVRWDARTGARRGLRIGFMALGAFALFAALVWPPTVVLIDPEGIVVRERHSLLGIVGLPSVESEHRYDWRSVGVAVSEEPSLVLTTGGHVVRIEPADDASALHRLHAFTADRQKRSNEQD